MAKARARGDNVGRATALVTPAGDRASVRCAAPIQLAAQPAIDLTSNYIEYKKNDLTNEDTEPLRAFLREHVSSFEELETLLHLARAPERSWTSLDIATSLKLPQEAIEGALGTLSERLIARDGSGAAGPTYRYAACSELKPQVEHLRRAYDEQRLMIMQFLSSNALERVRSSAARHLADAFRLERRRK